MKKEDYVTNLKKFQRRAALTMLVTSVVYLAILFAGFGLVMRDGVSTLLVVAIMILLIGGASAAFLKVILVSSKKQSKALNLDCPHCGKILSPEHLVVGSGKCPHCLERVLDPA